MTDISKITLPDNTTYNIKDKNARNFTNTPYYEQDEEALMFQLGESYMTGEQDNQPYLFRTAGGSAEIGNREYDKIIGGTVAWNQLMQKSDYPNSSNIFTNNGDGSVTANGTPSETVTFKFYNNLKSFTSNHVYLVYDGNRETGSDTTFEFMITSFFSSSNLNLYKEATVVRYQADNTGVHMYTVQAVVRANYAASNLKWRPQIFDLTQMFGTTIANYIYSLETATPGAGVAWFRKLFPKPYYEYNPGELMSVQAVAHKLVGFNAWDEEWELGIINTTTGEETDSNSNIRSKNYIRVIPGATYYFKLGTTDISNNIVFYDAEKNYVAASGEHVNDVFTVPEDAHYMKFYVSTNYGSVYLSNICINLSGNGERDGEYEEYEMHSYPLDSSLILRGIPKLDANNQLYYDGDTYEADGTVTQRFFTYIVTGNEVFNVATNQYIKQNSCDAYILVANLSRLYDRQETINGARCNRILAPATQNGLWAYDRPNEFTINSGQLHLNIANTLLGITDYTQETTTSVRNKIKAYCKELYDNGNPLIFVLPAAELAYVQAEPYDNPQIVDPEGTEEYITTNIVFVGHETKY